MIKFILRLVKALVQFILIEVPLQLVGAIILLIYLPFTSRLQLPYLLKWFDCADFYIDRDVTTYLGVLAQGWWARYKWLAWRNPINYFEYIYLGIKVAPDHMYTVYNPEEEQVGDSTGDRPGLRYIELQQDNKTYYEYYYIVKYSLFANQEQKCFRFRLGWKISDKNNSIGSYIQHVLVVSPYKSYSGV
jgi:hypothetical protein